MSAKPIYGGKRRMTQSRMLALTILQEYIDNVVDIVMDGDIVEMNKIVSLPLRIVTARRVAALSTEDEIERLFTATRARFIESGVDHVTQVAKKGYFTAPDQLYGEYETDRLRHSQRICAPYRSGIHLKREDGVWKQHKIMVLRRTDEWERASFKIGTEIDPIDGNGVDMRAEVWENSREAVEIADENLRTTAVAYNKNDFALFKPHFALPLTFTTFDSQRVLRTDEDLKNVFDSFRKYLDDNNATEFHRECISACFNSPDQITSTHVTTVKRGDQILCDPYPATSKLHFIDGKWLVGDSQIATTATKAPARKLGA